MHCRSQTCWELLHPFARSLIWPFWLDRLRERSKNRVIFSKLLLEPACSSHFDLHWASPHLPWVMQRLRTFCFLQCIYAFREIFDNQHVLLQLDLHWNSSKFPWGMHRSWGPFVLKTVIMPQFRETLSGLRVPGVQIVERGGRWGTSELNCTPRENGGKKRGGARAPFPL